MTFEQKFKEIFKDDLGNMFGYNTEHKRIVAVANDLSNGQLNSEEALLAVIKTGQGLRSSTPFLDNVRLPLTINFYMSRNFVPTFLSEFKHYTDEKNAVGFATEIDLDTVYYKIVYTDPYVLQGTLIWNIKNSNRTMELAQCTLMADVVYSTQVEYKQPQLTFVYDGVSYEIKNFSGYVHTIDSGQDVYQRIGDLTTRKEVISIEESFTISLQKTISDNFTTFLNGAIVGDLNLPKSKKLILNDREIPIQKISVSETFSEGLSFYEIVMSR